MDWTELSQSTVDEHVSTDGIACDFLSPLRKTTHTHEGDFAMPGTSFFLYFQVIFTALL
jgi:hypothetical protein